MSEQNPREELLEARRVVVKIGTKSITAGDHGRFGDVARQVAAARAQGRQVVLVSSGAIALGFPRLGLKARPTQMAELQASAATGQSRLMHAYEEAFAPYGIEVAQILLTHDGIADRNMYVNARVTLEALLARGCVPIINENDTIAVEEIRFGDNDQLAAMVATLVEADLLLLLTDVEGLLDAEGTRIATVPDVESVRSLVRPHLAGGLSLGGMESKLDAAHRASRGGLPVLIADARDPNILQQALTGADVGTLVLADRSPLASRKHWIAYSLKARGTISIDAGAVRALVERQSSLLPAGVVGAAGTFAPGDAVSVLAPDGSEIARGLARYGRYEVVRLSGVRASEAEITARLGHYAGDAVVHRDDLVLTVAKAATKC
ncbi:MAG: Glutamate 5-kinase [Myxococcaceae bacterium]|nr:Glutamate 5-kinase [Myxococcaceae bacterium]